MYRMEILSVISVEYVNSLITTVYTRLTRAVYCFSVDGFSDSTGKSFELFHSSGNSKSILLQSSYISRICEYTCSNSFLRNNNHSRVVRSCGGISHILLSIHSSSTDIVKVYLARIIFSS